MRGLHLGVVRAQLSHLHKLLKFSVLKGLLSVKWSKTTIIKKFVQCNLKYC